ncbi:HAMP domain-containing histidine kinase [Nostocoides sp. HKS02]|uniref:HAMP domain-containing histidine kinase n=1 Tax=Nostocoides sp. HKS02 TaxID=1813880 RepID=UPI0012B5034B|nr:HAMP domain-containing histidine kinase [Tetrasphaera sp. HKS02]QGN56996.1 hypothetical protein GKE56_02805 [Tetrasphaera sp. HKS02]
MTRPMTRPVGAPTPTTVLAVLMSSVALGAVATMGATAFGWPGPALGLDPLQAGLSMALPALVGAAVAALPGILLYARAAGHRATAQASLTGLLLQADAAERAVGPGSGLLSSSPAAPRPGVEVAVADSPTDAAVAAIDAQRRWADTAIASRRQVRLSALPAPALVSASPVPIGRVLDILIGAALKYGTGDIDIRLDCLGDRARIRVADQSPARDLPAQVGANREPRLALAKRITEALGGELTSSRERPTCFEVFLPKAALTAASHAA